MPNIPPAEVKVEGSEFSQNSLRLTRYSLGLISHEDLDEKDLPENGEENHGYEGRVHGVMDLLEKEMRRAMSAQLLFMGSEASDWDMVNFARGAINGIQVLWDRFNELNAAYLEYVQNLKEDSNK